ncbi:MAG: HPr family phosphocarrier protein [Lachnospiraceae bacterium]|nr:HPr family phosphocarrier protein [Lachnospiraceae bacterium]
MKEFAYTITDKLGIHARPAGLLTKLGKQLESKVFIKKGDKEAEITRIMSVMSLAVKQGEEVIVRVEGDKAEDFEVVKAFFQENL